MSKRVTAKEALQLQVQKLREENAAQKAEILGLKEDILWLEAENTRLGESDCQKSATINRLLGDLNQTGSSSKPHH